MRSYIIGKVTDGKICWDTVEKGMIDTYPWGQEYCPESFFQAVYIPNEAIIIKLTSYEKIPRQFMIIIWTLFIATVVWSFSLIFRVINR